jgi:hypothetical protein
VGFGLVLNWHCLDVSFAVFNSSEVSGMDIGGFGVHATLFPAGVLLLLALLAVIVFGGWKLGKAPWAMFS